MKKKIFSGVILVVVLAVAGGIFYLLSNLNSLVAKVIENQGSEVTATKVAVAGVDISLRDGRAGMSGLTIDSPDGFKAQPAIGLGEIAVDIDIESLRGEPIVIEEILVRAPVVNAEVHKDGSSNIGVINDNVQKFSRELAKRTGSGNNGGGDASAEDQKRIRIKKFVFEQGRIEVDASELGIDAQAVDLPVIRLNDIGGASGARPAEIAQAVLGALTRQATATIAKSGIETKAKEAARDEAEKLGKKLLDGLTD